MSERECNNENHFFTVLEILYHLSLLHLFCQYPQESKRMRNTVIILYAGRMNGTIIILVSQYKMFNFCCINEQINWKYKWIKLFFSASQYSYLLQCVILFQINYYYKIIVKETIRSYTQLKSNKIQFVFTL